MARPRAPRLPALPSIPGTTDPALQPFLQATKTILDNLSGANGTENAAVIQGDLAGAIRQSDYVPPPSTDTGTGNDTPTGPGINTPPPKLSGLQATGAFSSVILTWSEIPYGNSAYTIVYRNAVDDWDTAEPIGTSRVLLYSDYTPNFLGWYYWITTVSVTGLESPPNDIHGTQASSIVDIAYMEALINSGQIISSAAFKDAVILDAHIATVGADKIVANNLAAINANLGTVTAGEMRSPDGTFVIDLTNKEILITGPNGVYYDDYTIIKEGKIESWEYVDGGHQLAKALQRVEVGVATSGSTVTIPGYFASEPKIIVSPRELQVYDASSSAQDQHLVCLAENVYEGTPGNGDWIFTATAKLTLGGGDYYNAENDFYEDSDDDDAVQSSTYVSEGNCSKIVLNVKVRSIRGTGTAPTYHKRDVVLKLWGRENGTTDDYEQLGTTLTIYVNDLNEATGQLDSGTITSQTWDFYVTADFSDNGSATFDAGTGNVPYSARVPTSGYATGASKSFNVSNQDYSSTQEVKITFTGYSKPSNVTITSIKYYWKSGHYLYYNKEAVNCNVALSTTGDIGSYSKSCYSGYNSCSDSSGSSGAPLGTQKSKTLNTNSWSTTEQNYIKGNLVGLVEYGDYGTVAAQGQAQIDEAYCEITGYETQTNSTTPDNALTIVDQTQTLSSAAVLASGTLNWMAVR